MGRQYNVCRMPNHIPSFLPSTERGTSDCIGLPIFVLPPFRPRESSKLRAISYRICSQLCSFCGIRSLKVQSNLSLPGLHPIYIGPNEFVEVTSHSLNIKFSILLCYVGRCEIASLRLVACWVLSMIVS